MLRFSALLLALAASVYAVDVSTLQPQGYVNDFANVVDPLARQDLKRYCARVEKATGVQMAFVTLPTLGGDPVEVFANDLFRRWGIGRKGKDEGLLLLLVVNDRRSRLEIGRGLEPYITDGTAGELLRRMSPALREARYGEALGTAAHELGNRVARAKNVAIPTSEAPRRRTQEEPAQIPFGFMLAAVLFVFLLSGSTKRRRYGYGGGGGLLPGIILGSMMNRPTYGGQSHGGFGGYDSSDSFGGFGGGDSGGAGASSSW